MSRLPIIPPERMNAEQREVYDAIAAAGAPTAGPYTIYLRTPPFMRLHSAMGQCLRRNSLPGRLRQLIVLRTLKHWDAKYAWAVQVRASLREGVEQDFIDAIRDGREPALTSPKEIAALAVCRELVETHQVSQAAFDRALELFGENGVADIVETVGFFTMVSFTLNAFDVDPPTN